MRFPSAGACPKSDRELWLTMLEQALSTEYHGYSIEITNDQYDQTTTVVIIFSNVEDATFFRLSML